MGEIMTFLRKIILFTGILVLVCSSGSAWEIFPLLSYGSESGFLFGGNLTHNMSEPYNPFGFNCMAYYCTKGALRASPQFLFPDGGGLWRLTLDYRVSRNRNFYGSGNDGNPDTCTNYHQELQTAEVSYEFPSFDNFTVSAGVKVNHSSVYDREENSVWDSSPTDMYGSLWSTGPVIKAEYAFPVSMGGYADVYYIRQYGDGIEWSNLRSRIAVIHPITETTTPAFCITLNNHFNSEKTPFPFLSKLGGTQGLRGFTDDRFYGDISVVLNLELRQWVYSLGEGDGAFKFGFAAFGDAGQVANEFSELRWGRLHYDAGIGLRLGIPGGSVLRADVAYSDEGLGIQMEFGELF